MCLEQLQKFKNTSLTQNTVDNRINDIAEDLINNLKSLNLFPSQFSKVRDTAQLTVLFVIVM